MPKIFTSKTQKTGEIGENIAVRYLQNKGFKIKDRNYTRKWGEVDIIATKNKKIYFIEVKSVSCETLANDKESVSHETYRPEENMHPKKIERIQRTIISYLSENNIKNDVFWQLDLVLVYIDLLNKKAKVKTIENIV